MNEPCPVCGGTGFELRSGTDGLTVSSRCACSYKDRGERLLQNARLPRRYEQCSFANFEPHAPQAGNLAEVKAIAEDWFERWPQDAEVGLLFVGPPGTGKTHLGVALLRELALRKGAHVTFAEQRELLKALQATFDGATGRSETDVVAPIVEAEVLLLDDLGAGRTTAWAQDVMHDVLAQRYNAKLPTLMTTNRALEEEAAEAGVPSLRDRLGDALMSRIYEMCRIVPVNAPDFRRVVRHAQYR